MGSLVREGRDYVVCLADSIAHREEKTLLDKPAVPPVRHRSLRGTLSVGWYFRRRLVQLRVNLSHDTFSIIRSIRPFSGCSPRFPGRSGKRLPVHRDEARPPQYR